MDSISFIQENSFENIACQNGGHFVRGGGRGELRLVATRTDKTPTENRKHHYFNQTHDSMWTKKKTATLQNAPDKLYHMSIHSNLLSAILRRPVNSWYRGPQEDLIDFRVMLKITSPGKSPWDPIRYWPPSWSHINCSHFVSTWSDDNQRHSIWKYRLWWMPEIYNGLVLDLYLILIFRHIEGILLKVPYLPCVSMVGRALLVGYHWLMIGSDVRKLTNFSSLRTVGYNRINWDLTGSELNRPRWL